MRFYYLGQFDNNGVSNLINIGASGTIFDNNASSYVSEVNTLLPEYSKLHHVHPEWLTDNSLDFLDNTELSITFLDEGAGYRNAVGYFIYDSSNPPPTLNHISECYFIFPNCSKVNSGGNLHPGDTIRLPYGFTKSTISGKDYITGTDYNFPAGKSVGFIIYPNGWNGSGVSQYIVPYTSCSWLNPEKAPELKYHTACIKLSTTDKLVLAFEDLNRESSGCDHDFNDAVFVINTTLNNIGKGYTDKDGFQPSADEPDMPTDYVIGYKKVYSNVDGNTVECVATLYIPKTATILKKKNYPSRCKTDEAYVKSIIVVPPETNIGKNYAISRKLTSAYSWYDHNFIYNTKSRVYATVDENTLTGIYFYYTFNEAADYAFNPLKV